MGIDNTAARCKIGEWQAKAREFTEQTGIRRDRAREYIGMPNGEKQPKALKPLPATPKMPKVTRTAAPKSEGQKKAIDMKGLIDNQKSSTRGYLEYFGVKTREVFMLDKPLKSHKIIARIGGGDKTDGSCSSVAFAYAANKAGFDVRDFRGGASREWFSRMSAILEIAKLNGVKSKIVSGIDDILSAFSLMREMEPEKEYYLATGCHAAIVRKTKKGVAEYLELQSDDIIRKKFGLKPDNKFHPLTIDSLINRFGCTFENKTEEGVKHEALNILIDIESLGKNKEFVKLMEYINTSESEQLKGLGGYAK